MPLVEVVEVDGQVEGRERAHAADAQEHLLGDAAVGPRVVEPLRDPAVPGMHGLEEEERGDGIAAHAPDAALDLPRGDAHADPHRRVHEEVHLLLVPLVQRIAVGPDPLGDVALGPAQPDADYGKAEVARRFHEVAREDAESAGVGGELLVQAVLHGEVRDEGHQGSQSSTMLPSGSRMRKLACRNVCVSAMGSPPRDRMACVFSGVKVPTEPAYSELPWQHGV